ncbi:MAG: radical SAM/Cys-rich domain protein [Coriobacteriaceae bacterium]|nr:radical SAM/Cys-rich domain protein [Coriobacteriaceae bacterium]
MQKGDDPQSASRFEADDPACNPARLALDAFPAFEERLDQENSHTRDALGIMQVNVGRRCNLSCKHCHVQAGPDRIELMDRPTMADCLDAFCAGGFTCMDITGGAPEMNPDFEWLIRTAASRGIPLMVRSNLVILEEEGFTHLPKLYADLGVTLVASLPHYTQKAMEKQRGEASFEAVIRVLRKLNALGYGRAEGNPQSGLRQGSAIHDQVGDSFVPLGVPVPTPRPGSAIQDQVGDRFDGFPAEAQQVQSPDDHPGSLQAVVQKGPDGDGCPNLELDLVFNPGGAFLPPDQAALEREYRQKLWESYRIVFDHLFAITNNPLGRFGDFLCRSGNLEAYMGRLIAAFNPSTLPSMMCRNQVSVGWDGRLYDCDFNQAAGLPCKNGMTIAGLAKALRDRPEAAETTLKREIRFGNHCYACCAGSGSSCGGATA